MKPISVIIVNFNTGSLLSSCVASVLASNIPVQVIVADNGSHDTSIAEVKTHFAEDPRLTLLENHENLGFAKANNRALSFAQGDFILFLNPDCILHPETLEQMLRVLKEHPEAGMAGCLIRNPDGSEQAGCRRSVPTPWRTFLRITRLSSLAKYHTGFESYVQTGRPMPEQPVPVEAISGAFMLVRRTAIDQVGVMDEGYFMHCEDLDWCMRFRQRDLAILFVPQVEILHIGGVCSASRPIAVEYYKHKGMVRFYHKFFRSQYPAVLMWLVMLAIGMRFSLRALGYLVRGTKPRKNSIEVVSVAHHFSKSAYPPLSDARRRVIVTGATSLIGDYLLPGLIHAGIEVHAISRNPPKSPAIPLLKWHKTDITRQGLGDSFGADTLIHLAPLSTLPPLLESLAAQNITRLIAFGSTSLFTKCDSNYPKERQFAQGLKTAEATLAESCARLGIHWTVFRPTLVYRLGRDKNVTTIANFIRRFGFFPLVGSGNGLRQPVHAEDLAQACLNALDNPNSHNKAYNLSGGEVLTYRDMVQRIANTLGKSATIITIPLPAFRIFLRGLSYLPFYRHLTPEMANRINLDMCFDHTPASEELSFSPRNFLENQLSAPLTQPLNHNVDG